LVSGGGLHRWQQRGKREGAKGPETSFMTEATLREGKKRIGESDRLSRVFWLMQNQLSVEASVGKGGDLVVVSGASETRLCRGGEKEPRKKASGGEGGGGGGHGPCFSV